LLIAKRVACRRNEESGSSPHTPCAIQPMSRLRWMEVSDPRLYSKARLNQGVQSDRSSGAKRVQRLFGPVLIGRASISPVSIR
jgi:hypothetical protein